MSINIHSIKPHTIYIFIARIHIACLVIPYIFISSNDIAHIMTHSAKSHDIDNHGTPGHIHRYS